MSLFLTCCVLDRLIDNYCYITMCLFITRNGSNVKRLLLMVSFLDGLELMDGYESGFGLYYVDLGDKNLTRHPKLSQRWYSNFLKGI